MTVWDSLVGQPQAVEALTRAAEVGRRIADKGGLAGEGSHLAHSWLITGPPGSGRSVAARCLAAALQCTGDVVGCGFCSGCHTTMIGNNLDVTVVATEKVIINIDEVRELLAVAQTSPRLGRWRVIIIEDADRMTERTSNLLLKSLEEPPERTVWILCAPTPGDLLTTIRSRCRSLQLGIPSAEAVAQLLVNSEGVSYEQALMASRVSQSHIGVARALVQEPELRASRVALFAMPLRVGNVGEGVVAAAKMVTEAKEQGSAQAGQRDAAERADLLKALGIEEGKRIPPSLRSQIKELEDEQKRREKRSLSDALDRTLVDLLSFFRDVSVLQVGAQISLVNADLEQEIHQWASASTIEQTLARTEAIDLARTRLQTNVAPLLAMEALCISLYDPRLA